MKKDFSSLAPTALRLIVTSVWIAVMAAMWIRESGGIGLSLRKMGVSPEVLMVSWVDYEQWLWIEQQGRRIGLTYLEIRPTTTLPVEPRDPKKLPGYTMRSHTILTFRLLGQELPLDLTTKVELNAAFEMDSLQALIRAAGEEMRMQAFVDGKQLFYRLKVSPETTTGGKGQAQSIQSGMMAVGQSLLARRDICGQSPLAEPIFLSDAVIPILTRSETLRKGQRWTTKASDPIQGLLHASVQVTIEDKERLELNGEKIETWRMTEQIGSTKSKVWYDLRGRILRRDLISGLRLIQATPVNAKQLYHNFDNFNHLERLWKIDRPWIKQHVDPSLRGKPFSELLPSMPSL